jgi:hypothetical protein
MNDLPSPVNLHNRVMNELDRINQSELPVYKKIPAQLGLNLAAVITGIAACVFESAKFALSVPTAILIKYAALGTLRLITCHKSETLNAAYDVLPGVQDCAATAFRAVKQFVGIVPSLTGVLVFGSNWNVNEQHRLGNCSIRTRDNLKAFEKLIPSPDKENYPRLRVAY